MLDDLSISEKRAAILERMEGAAKRAGRAAEAVTLVAVSKMQPYEGVADMLATGQRVFGENRVQEAQARWGKTFANYRKDIELRLIGPLQTNKAEDAVRLFDVIETLDRDKLARALLKAGEKLGHMPKLLVQVNTGAEPQKSGLAPNEVLGFLARLKSEYNLTPEGLMCIPPQMSSMGGEAVSPHFWLLKKLADEHGLPEISMGMSGDFETAIELGATHVRIGSAVFGDRSSV